MDIVMAAVLLIDLALVLYGWLTDPHPSGGRRARR
jgi:hypothetical protein